VYRTIDVVAGADGSYARGYRDCDASERCMGTVIRATCSGEVFLKEIEGPCSPWCSQGASWFPAWSAVPDGVPPYEFLNLHGISNSRFSGVFPEKRLELKSLKEDED
jgi:hypothetical protein